MAMRNGLQMVGLPREAQENTETLIAHIAATVVAPNGDRIENVANDSRCQPLCCGASAYGTEVSAWQCKI